MSGIDLIDKPGGIFERLGAVEIVANTEVISRQDGDTALQTQVNNLGVRVNNSETAIQEEVTQRANADNAITEQVNTQYASVNQSITLIQNQQTTTANSVASLSTATQTLQSSVNGLSSSVQTESETRASADGHLMGQYTVKIQLNGLIAGFGLASESKYAGPATSTFIVRADKFAIASPTTFNPNNPMAADTTAVPFIVLTTPTVVNGAVRQAGVYISDAVIGNAAITTAKIGDAAITSAKIVDAAVDTLKLKGNSVTIPMFVSGSFNMNFPLNAPLANILEMSGTFPEAGNAAIISTIKVEEAQSSNPDIKIRMRLLHNGSAVFDQIFSVNKYDSVVSVYGISVPKGTRTFRLEVSGNMNTNFVLKYASMLVLGVLR